MQRTEIRSEGGEEGASEQRRFADNRRLQSETIDWMRFPLIIFVVSIHSFGWPEAVNLAEIDYGALSGMDVYNIIRVLVREIVSICNSCFFLFSGYFFFCNTLVFNKKEYMKKIRARFKSLFVPYVLWILIAVICQAGLICAGRIVRQDGDWGRLAAFFNETFEKGVWSLFWDFSKWGGGVNILGWPTGGVGPVNLTLWFLQTLIVLALVSPIIYLICKYLKRYGILLLGLLYYTGIWFSVPGFGIGAVFFFALGAYYGIYKKNMVIELRRYEVFWYLVALLTLLPAGWYDYDGLNTFNYFKPLLILAEVISAVNIASRLVEAKKVKVHKTLAKATFFVYLMHTTFVLTAVRLTFIKAFGNDSPFLLTVEYFATPIITAYACVIIYCLMKKVMPRTLKILSGDR
jgi:hypothetical protein